MTKNAMQAQLKTLAMAPKTKQGQRGNNTVGITVLTILTREKLDAPKNLAINMRPTTSRD